MNSLFVIMAVLLTASALMFLVLPLARRARPAIQRSRSAANLELLRDEKARLEAERGAGRLSEAEYREELQELERRVVEDALAPDPAPALKPSNRPVAIGLVLLVPLVAAVVYAAIGNPRAIDAPRGTPRVPHAVAPQQISAMVDRLAERLKGSPENVDGWTMLARSLAALGRHEESAQAYAQLAKLVPDNAGVLADYADMLAMAQGRKLAGRPSELVLRALELDPHHIKALALAGSSDFERGNYKGAVAYWERILARIPPESDFARSVQASIAQARAVL